MYKSIYQALPSLRQTLFPTFIKLPFLLLKALLGRPGAPRLMPLPVNRNFLRLSRMLLLLSSGYNLTQWPLNPTLKFLLDPGGLLPEAFSLLDPGNSVDVELPVVVAELVLDPGEVRVGDRKGGFAAVGVERFVLQEDVLGLVEGVEVPLVSRLEGRFSFLGLDGLPVDALQEGMGS